MTRGTRRHFTPKERLFGNLQCLREEILTYVTSDSLKKKLIWLVDAALSWEPRVVSVDDPRVKFPHTVSSARHNRRSDQPHQIG